MKRTIPFLFVLSVLTVIQLSCVFAKSSLGERLRERIAERKEKKDEGFEELAYGKDPLQKLDYYRPEKAGSPLVVFVHGGGWKRGDKRDAGSLKPEHYLDDCYSFASIN